MWRNVDILQDTVYVITGPTASGKSALAVSLAQRTDAEIISADSRQIYKGIPVLTAVPTEEERGDIRHHLLETLPLHAPFSAYAFEKEAVRITGEIIRRGKRVIICGGSMLYVKAFCEGLDEIPDIPAHIRENICRQFETEGIDSIIDTLRMEDPLSASRIDLSNPRRIIHALEVTRTAGTPYSSLLGNKKRCRGFDVVTVNLTCDRDILFNRINNRVDFMMNNGALEEARRVYPLKNHNSLHTVGFNELFAYFEGKMDYDTAVARIAKNTRVFAKKQITWIKKNPCDHSIDISSPDAEDNLYNSLINV